jgi:hypothetical protein
VCQVEDHPPLDITRATTRGLVTPDPPATAIPRITTGCEGAGLGGLGFA